MFERVIAGALLIVVAGCQGAGDAGESILGRYALQTMDGQAPPVPSPEQPEMMVVSLTLRLTADRFELGS